MVIRWRVSAAIIVAALTAVCAAIGYSLAQASTQPPSAQGRDGTYRLATAPAGNTIRVLDSAGDVGLHTSIAIGADGLPVISYYDATNADLKVAHCDDATCATATLRAIDSGGDVGAGSSIAIGSDKLPIISYYDATNGDLKIAHCGDATCSSAVPRTLDSSGDVGKGAAIAIGSDGLPITSYVDSTNGALKVAHCGDSACAAADIRTWNGANGVVDVYGTSIAKGADGLPIIIYADGGAQTVAHCEDVTCQTMAVTALPRPGYYPSYSRASIAAGSDGLPVIALEVDYGHWGFTSWLNVAHCNGVSCSGVATSSFDSSWDWKIDPSIAIGSDGLPIVSYYTGAYGANSQLRVVHCADVACGTGYLPTTATIYTVDNVGDVGNYSSISVGLDGLPVISYYDATNGDLKVVHCGDVTCEVPTLYLPLAGK